MTEPILDPATERGIITRMTARNEKREDGARLRGVMIPPPRLMVVWRRIAGETEVKVSKEMKR